MKEPSTQGFYRPDGTFDLEAYKKSQKKENKIHQKESKDSLKA